MGYCEYIKQLFEPLRLYASGGTGDAELEAIGGEFDKCLGLLQSAEKESLVVTAEDEGLEGYERILPYTPAYISASDRRRAILALLRIDECSFTQTALNDTIAGCGIRAVVREGAAAQTVIVSFPYNRGIPDNIDELKFRIEEILPCHLNIEYHYIYTVWGEIEAFFGMWSELHAEIGSWREIEIYSREE